MEKIVQKTLLFDFYGELLTKHQQEIYEDVVLNDTSCSDEAAMLGVSRQGVNDLIRRVDRQLETYENSLRLVEKFLKIRQQVQKIRDLAGASESSEEITQICDCILKEL